MANTSITNSKKTFNKFVQNFESTFYPFNTKAASCTELSKLMQKSFKKDDRTTDDSFQWYITDFQNLSLKTGIKDKLYLINQFSLGVDQKIASVILSMANIPTTSTGWIDQAKIFHAQKMWILTLQAGQVTPQVHPSSHPQYNPNAMEVDAITLSKLTPVKQAKCMKEGQCFRCQKLGHNAQNCCASFPPNMSTPSHPDMPGLQKLPPRSLNHPRIPSPLLLTLPLMNM